MKLINLGNKGNRSPAWLSPIPLKLVSNSKIRAEEMHDKLSKNNQEKNEINRIFGVLKRNLNKNEFVNENIQNSDPKRNQIRMLLDKHLQMKQEAFEWTQTLVFDPEKEILTPINLSFDNQEILNGFYEIFDKTGSEAINKNAIKETNFLEVENCQPSRGETAQYFQDENSSSEPQNEEQKEMSVCSSAYPPTHPARTVCPICKYQ